jgi:flagellar biogenesis protein FliO
MLIVALAGVRAARPPVLTAGPWHDEVLPLAGAFEFVLAMLLVALWLIARRRPNPGYLAAVLRAGLRRVLVLGMVAVAALAGLSRLNPHLNHPPHLSKVPAPLKPVTPRPVRGTAASQNSANLTYIVYALVALLLLAAIVACVLVILRRLPASSAGDVPLVPDDDASMRAVIESGRRALQSFDDAQAAIIACYVAMEASLAGVGTARTAAETPDELLARALKSGLLQGTAAERLTALFYEARYSSHAMPATARDEAVRALDDISAELTRRADSSPVSSPSPQGATP